MSDCVHCGEAEVTIEDTYCQNYIDKMADQYMAEITHPDIPYQLLNQITTGDTRELAKHMPDGSVDLIFTDPPYRKEYLYLYEWLAEEAQRILKPGGFLLTYAGNTWKYEVMLSLGKHLTYFWDYTTIDIGSGTIIWNRKTVAKSKSILAFSKDGGLPRCNTLGLWNGTGTDKRFHSWGQDESAARYYIDCFSSPGDLIWEPFTGGGTTPYICKMIGRHFIAFELDCKAAHKALQRLETVQPFLIPEQEETQPVLWEAST